VYLGNGAEDGEGGAGGRAGVVEVGLLSCSWVLVVELVLFETCTILSKHKIRFLYRGGIEKD
jgi:hypothetical protein